MALLLSIVVLAQSASTNSTASINTGISISTPGLVISYKAHLFIAEEWVARLNESGINSIPVLNLISKAKAEASQGDYLNAILTLNQAIRTAAQLMAQSHVNNTGVLISSYEGLTGTVNNTAEAVLTSNETVARMALNLLSYGEARANTTQGINEDINDINIAIDILTQLMGQARTETQVGAINGTINLLITIRNYLRTALENNNPEVALGAMAMGRAGIAALLETNKTARYHEVSMSVSPAVLNLRGQLINYLGLLSGELNASVPEQPYLSCLSQLNSTLEAMESLGPGLGLVGINESVNSGVEAYLNCVSEAHEVHEVYVNTTHVINEFNEILNELSAKGLVNYTPVLSMAYLQCRSQLSSALYTGNLSLVEDALAQCHSEHLYRAREALQFINSVMNYLTYLNNTIINIATSHGVPSHVAMICMVMLRGNVTNELTNVLKLMLNGTITPLQAQEMINDYLNSVSNATVIARCLGMPGGYHGIIPMGTGTAPQVVAYGSLITMGNGASLLIHVINMGQGALSITGLAIGGLECEFSNAINIASQGSADIEISLEPTGFLTYTATGAEVNGEVMTGLTCTGSLSISPGQGSLSASLMLSTGSSITFNVGLMSMISAQTSGSPFG